MQKANKGETPPADIADVKMHAIRGTESSITMWHRPKVRHIKALRDLIGVNFVVSCLGEKEKPLEICNICEELSVQWTNIPLNGAQEAYLREGATVALLCKYLRFLEKRIKAKKEVLFVHCAAGIHRTGLVTYSLLRLCGYSSDEAKQTLLQIRETTAKNVGQERLQYVEEHVLPALAAEAVPPPLAAEAVPPPLAAEAVPPPLATEAVPPALAAEAAPPPAIINNTQEEQKAIDD